MSLEESCYNVVKIMTKHNLVTEKRSDEEIQQFISNLHQTDYDGAYPLQILPYLNPGAIICICHYDDCNNYQEDGYYVGELTKISTHSQGQINFSHLVEDYDKGMITLTYKLNGKAGKLTFNLDTRDFVPEEYVKFVKTTMTSMSGEYRYLYFEEDVYLIFCLLPENVANELEAIKANEFISIRNK